MVTQSSNSRSNVKLRLIIVNLKRYLIIKVRRYRFRCSNLIEIQNTIYKYVFKNSSWRRPSALTVQTIVFVLKAATAPKTRGSPWVLLGYQSMVHQSRRPPFWAPLLACRSLSQPSCSEAVVVTIIFSCFLTKRSLKCNLVHFGYFLTNCSVKCNLDIYFPVTICTYGIEGVYV